MNYMAMEGWKTREMIDGIDGIMNLADASGESLGTTSDIVTDALTAFVLTAADSGNFADVLATASSNGNIDQLTIRADKYTIRYRVRTIDSKNYFSWMENMKNT